MPSFTVDKDFPKWVQAIKNVNDAGQFTEDQGIEYWDAVKAEYKSLGGKFKGLKYE